MTTEITVFTPTYNRGYIIQNLYESLKRQTYRNFEWLVIDDGSTDDTEELFSNWIAEGNDFPIIYHKTKNGGKHRAINIGIELAAGRMFFIVDSDDYLTDEALMKVTKWERTISGNKEFHGVAGQRGYTTTDIIGKTFSGDFLDASHLEREKVNIYGDKAEIYYTSILAKYKFPEFQNENFVTESVVSYEMANDGYKIRWFNEIIYISGYLEDGLTRNLDKVIINNPKGYLLSVKQIYVLKQLHWFKRFKTVSMYTRYSKLIGLSKKQASREIGINFGLFILLGFFYALYKKIS